jgi:hypothetical protein
VAAADVDRLGLERGMHRQEVRPDRVVDVSEVAGLLAVTEQLDGLALWAALRNRRKAMSGRWRGP